jgi:hypothetical protein
MKSQREARTAVDEGGMGFGGKKSDRRSDVCYLRAYLVAVAQLRFWGAREENGQSADVT